MEKQTSLCGIGFVKAMAQNAKRGRGIWSNVFCCFCVLSRYQIVVEIIQATTLSSIPQLKKQKGKTAGSGPFSPPSLVYPAYR